MIQTAIQAEVDTADAERDRVRRDLHDSLAPELTGLALSACALARRLQSVHTAESDAAQRLADGIQRALTELRAISRGLDPSASDEPDLYEGLRRLAESVFQTCCIDCAFEGERTHLDRKTSRELLLIAKEAVTNSVRHSKARSITIRLDRVEDMTSLRIEDDGAGLAASGNSGSGCGLANMRHRARTIGATIRIFGNVPRGTVVLCTVPHEGEK